MLPVVNGAEAISLREKYDFILVLEIGGAFIQSYFTVDNQIQTLCIFLLLINERFLLELGKEHVAADMVYRREVIHKFYRFYLIGESGTFRKILTRLLTSAIVLFSGSDMRISNTDRRSFFLM